MKRIYHHWEKWECVKAGFYDNTPPKGTDSESCCKAYADFLSNLPRFEAALQRVLLEWPHSCDQFLSNENINRIAWLGQSSMCIETGIPSVFRGGFRLLSRSQQTMANAMAEKYLKIWLKQKGDSAHETGDGIHQDMGAMRLF